MKKKRGWSLLLIAIAVLITAGGSFADLHFKPFVKSYPTTQSPNWEQDAEVLAEVWWNAPAPNNNKLTFINGSYQYSTAIFAYSTSQPTFIGTTALPGLSEINASAYNTSAGSALFIRTIPGSGTPLPFAQQDYLVFQPDLIINNNASGSAALTFNPSQAKAGGLSPTGGDVDLTNGYGTLTVPITPASPPTGFTGPSDTTSRNVTGLIGNSIGNTVHIDWTDLNSAPFTNDDTPPIKYDIYVKEGPDFTAANLNGEVYRAEADLSGNTKRIGSMGVPDTSSSLRTLKDKTTYYFRMRAKDSTTQPDVLNRHKTTNTDPGGAQNKFVAIHINDLTAPEGITISPNPPAAANQQITVAWGAPANDGADLDGYIVLRSDGASNLEAPDLGGAGTDDSDGPDYSAIAANAEMTASPASFPGWFKAYQGKATQFTDSGLDNKKKYKYAVYAYDVIDANQQGRNYTTVPQTCIGQPGEAPDMVENFIAISSPETNQITLMWDIPAASAGFYKGAKIVYTTNKFEWSKLTVGSPEAKDFVLSAADATSQIVTITQVGGTTAPTNLDPNAIYYFKAYAYNDSNMSKPNGAMAAAVPALGGQGGGGSINFSLTAGPNIIGIPKFISNIMINNVGVVSLQELVAAINTIAGTSVVTSISYLDLSTATKQLRGATYDPAGNVTYADFDLNTPVPLVPGQAYQLTLSSTVSTLTFVLKAQ